MKIILKKEVEDIDTDNHVIFIDRLDIPMEKECKEDKNDSDNT